jgi:Prokaryotic homologs of the JAB domain
MTKTAASKSAWFGDGVEAAALLLCTQVRNRRKKRLGREIIAVPYVDCTRRPGEYVEAAIDRAALRGDAVIAAHSHPSGSYALSDIDDKSDVAPMSALQERTDQTAGSAIMIPGGATRARIYESGCAVRWGKRLKKTSNYLPQN